MNDYFWKATVPELKRGFYFNSEDEQYTCLICGKTFKDGIIYPIRAELYTACKAVEVHCGDAHGDMFDYFLEMGKAYTGLTEHQKKLLKMFYDGYTDKEIAGETEATNTSTIRNQRFAFREKYKQAKITVAIAELLEEKRAGGKRARENQKEGLIEIHRTATMVDERYAITQAEKDEVLSRYFGQDDKLMVKTFPAKEKNKIIILQHLAEKFEPNRTYSEQEVNAVISGFYEDIPTVRRYLIQYGFLDRKPDGGEYWVKQ